MQSLKSLGLRTSKNRILKVVCLRPVHIYGAGDILALTSLELGKKGFVPLWDSGSCDFVYVCFLFFSINYYNNIRIFIMYSLRIVAMDIY